MLYRLFKKCLILGTILLLGSGGLGFPCDPASTGPVAVVIPGLGTYSSLQDAIDNANPGDQVIVVSGKCIHERITVDKPLTITGEKNLYAPCPVIDGRCGGNIITIEADGVIIENLVIENYNVGDLPFSCGPLYAGILVNSSNNIIRNNIIRRCPKGVYLTGGGSGNQVYDNKITCNIQNYTGIMLAGSSNNSIYSNEIKREPSLGNYMFPLGDGMSLTQSSGNTIVSNTFDNHAYGIILVLNSNNNIIHHNNFLDNIYYHALIENSIGACTGNQWDNGSSSGGNYWSGHTCIDSNGDCICDDPYSITGGAGDQDNYPLLTQFAPVCGNVNGSPGPCHRIDILDVVYLVNYIYRGGPPPIPPCSGDLDGDGDVDGDDLDILIDYVYRNIPFPNPTCCPSPHCF
jgi:parallel beta-helix repeat protein